MIALSISQYAAKVRPLLPAEAFRPAPSRLGWLALHLALATVGVGLIGTGRAPPWAWAPLALMIGNSFACLGFVAHEALHGSVVRGRRLRHLIGFVGFLPFVVSPRHWTLWHNRLHHGHTMEKGGNRGGDPDSPPVLSEYRDRRLLRVLHHVSLGHGHPLGWLSLAFGFPVQSLQLLARLGFDRRTYSRRDQLVAIAETAAGVAFWIAIGVLLGPGRFTVAVLLPVLIGGAVMMSYILTNHGLSPLTQTNDPLLNSLSVTTPALVSRLHLNFGYHVEHHLFPSMSPKHAPALQALVLRLWPDRYQRLPLLEAVRRLARTSRLYRGPATLFDPVSGRRWPALLPATESATLATVDEREAARGGAPAMATARAAAG